MLECIECILKNGTAISVFFYHMNLFIYKHNNKRKDGVCRIYMYHLTLERALLTMHNLNICIRICTC